MNHVEGKTLFNPIFTNVGQIDIFFRVPEGKYSALVLLTNYT